MEVGYSFWQGDFDKNEKMHLDQDFNKPSIEVSTPWSRVYNMLDRGYDKTSIEILINPWTTASDLDRGLKNGSIEG